VKVRIAAALIALSAILITAQAGGRIPRKEDIPKYIEALKTSQSGKDRAFAAEQIGKRGQIQVNDVKDALDLLRRSLKKDIEPSVRRAAAGALGNIATEPEQTVPALMDALKDRSAEVSLAAVSALGQFGADAKKAVPALREFAKKKNDKKVNQLVNVTIKQIVGKKQ
jgi:HEAT repeat protein